MTRMLAQLFHPFEQADTTLSRSRGGLGLGLALVRGVVEIHGGNVTGRSEGPGRGAEFVIRLPLIEGVEITETTGKPATESGSLRVLVIDDNADAANSLCEVLELGGHRTQVAYNGPQGLVLAREFKPDVVLCDIGLPEMDGYEVARALRVEPDEAVRSAHLVALTGYAQPEDQLRAEQAGFDAHLAKPPSLEKLEESLQMVWRRRQS